MEQTHMEQPTQTQTGAPEPQPPEASTPVPPQEQMPQTPTTRRWPRMLLTVIVIIAGLYFYFNSKDKIAKDAQSTISGTGAQNNAGAQNAQNNTDAQNSGASGAADSGIQLLDRSAAKKLSPDSQGRYAYTGAPKFSFAGAEYNVEQMGEDAIYLWQNNEPFFAFTVRRLAKVQTIVEYYKEALKLKNIDGIRDYFVTGPNDTKVRGIEYEITDAEVKRRLVVFPYQKVFVDVLIAESAQRAEMDKLLSTLRFE